MRLWIVGAVLTIILGILFVRPFSVHVTSNGRLYIVNTFTGSGKVCIHRRCVPLEERR